MRIKPLCINCSHELLVKYLNENKKFFKKIKQKGCIYIHPGV